MPLRRSQRPAVVLDVRHLEPLGAEAHRQIDDARQAVDVLAMDRRVDGERQAERAHPAGRFQLLGVAIAIVGDAVGVGGIGGLDRDLHVVEAMLGQLVQPLAGKQHGGSDQVGVEADLGRPRDDLLEVAAHGRLAAGEVQLQDAEIGGLRQHVEPGFGRQLAGDALQRQRIGAVGALQRAAVRQLRQQAHGRKGAGGGVRRLRRCCGSRRHAVTTPLSARSCRRAEMSARMRSLGAL